MQTDGAARERELRLASSIPPNTYYVVIGPVDSQHAKGSTSEPDVEPGIEEVALQLVQRLRRWPDSDLRALLGALVQRSIREVPHGLKQGRQVVWVTGVIALPFVAGVNRDAYGAAVRRR